MSQNEFDRLLIENKTLQNQLQTKELLIDSYVETIDNYKKRLIIQEEIIAGLKK